MCSAGFFLKDIVNLKMKCVISALLSSPKELQKIMAGFQNTLPLKKIAPPQTHTTGRANVVVFGLAPQSQFFFLKPQCFK